LHSPAAVAGTHTNRSLADAVKKRKEKKRKEKKRKERKGKERKGKERKD